MNPNATRQSAPNLQGSGNHPGGSQPSASNSQVPVTTPSYKQVNDQTTLEKITKRFSYKDQPPTTKPKQAIDVLKVISGATVKQKPAKNNSTNSTSANQPTTQLTADQIRALEPRKNPIPSETTPPKPIPQNTQTPPTTPVSTSSTQDPQSKKTSEDPYRATTKALQDIDNAANIAQSTALQATEYQENLKQENPEQENLKQENLEQVSPKETSEQKKIQRLKSQIRSLNGNPSADASAGAFSGSSTSAGSSSRPAPSSSRRYSGGRGIAPAAIAGAGGAGLGGTLAVAGGAGSATSPQMQAPTQQTAQNEQEASPQQEEAPLQQEEAPLQQEEAPQEAGVAPSIHQPFNPIEAVRGASRVARKLGLGGSGAGTGAAAGAGVTGAGAATTAGTAVASGTGTATTATTGAALGIGWPAILIILAIIIAIIIVALVIPSLFASTNDVIQSQTQVGNPSVAFQRIGIEKQRNVQLQGGGVATEVLVRTTEGDAVGNAGKVESINIRYFYSLKDRGTFSSQFIQADPALRAEVVDIRLRAVLGNYPFDHLDSGRATLSVNYPSGYSSEPPTVTRAAGTLIFENLALCNANADDAGRGSFQTNPRGKRCKQGVEEELNLTINYAEDNRPFIYEIPRLTLSLIPSIEINFYRMGLGSTATHIGYNISNYPESQWIIRCLGTEQRPPDFVDCSAPNNAADALAAAKNPDGSYAGAGDIYGDVITNANLACPVSYNKNAGERLTCTQGFRNGHEANDMNVKTTIGRIVTEASIIAPERLRVIGTNGRNQAYYQQCGFNIIAEGLETQTRYAFIHLDWRKKENGRFTSARDDLNSIVGVEIEKGSKLGDFFAPSGAQDRAFDIDGDGTIERCWFGTHLHLGLSRNNVPFNPAQTIRNSCNEPLYSC
jgi:hypothetical protein